MSARPWIECYIWSDGTSSQPVFAQRLKGEEGIATSDNYLSAPLSLTAALDEWIAALTAALASTYSWRWDRSTNRITIASDGPAWTLTLYNDLAAVLGFASGVNFGASSYTGTLSPRGFVPLDDGIECDPVDSAGEIDLFEYAFGRSRAAFFTNHDLVNVAAWVADADFAAMQSYCGSGRVRVHLTGSVAALSSVAPGGYVDGYIHGIGQVDALGGSEQFRRVEMLIGRAA